MKIVIYYLQLWLKFKLLTIWRKKSRMRRSGVQVFFIVDEERGDPNTIESGFSLPPSETPLKLPAKRHFNGVSLVDQWWPNIKNAVLEILWYPGVTSIAKKPYHCLIFQGVQTPAPYPLSPLWIRACLELSRIDLFLEPNEPAQGILGGLNRVPLKSLISKI